MTPDAELMQAFRDGDHSAFTKLTLRHEVGLLNFFLRMGASQADAEDLVQDVLLKVYRAAERYESKALFTTWLYRIARNCWIDTMRRCGRQPGLVSADKESAATGTTIAETLPSHTPQPSARMEQSETATLIHEAIGQLPELQREVFVLSEIQGMKYQEIAETLDVPLGTVKSRMFMAVHSLRQTLAAHGLSG